MYNYAAKADAIRIQRAHIHAHQRYALTRALEERKLRILKGHPLADIKYWELTFALGRNEQHPEFGSRDLSSHHDTVVYPKGRIHINKF